MPVALPYDVRLRILRVTHGRTDGRTDGRTVWDYYGRMWRGLRGAARSECFVFIAKDYSTFTRSTGTGTSTANMQRYPPGGTVVDCTVILTRTTRTGL